MRNKYFDVIKGYAIILVVLGHVIQNFVPDYKVNSLFLFIYSFHMPLFVSVSGYFFLKSVDKISILNYIRNKFLHLYLPSICMGAINCAFIGVSKVLQHKDLEPAYFTNLLFTGLWFLTVLFIISIIGCLFRKVLKSRMYLGWFLFLIVLYFLPNIWLSHEILFLTPFFVTSIALSRYNWSQIPTWLSLFSILGFIFLFLNFDFSMTMYMMDDYVMSWNHLYVFLYRFLIGVAGCMTSFLVCRTVMRQRILANVLAYVGCLTLPIYALHQKFLEWNIFTKYSVSNYVLLLIITALVLSMSIFAYKLLRKNNLFALMLFGEKKYDKQD